MEDKMFEMMTRIYSELTEFRKDITQKVEENSRHALRLKNGQKKIQSIIENDIKNV